MGMRSGMVSGVIWYGVVWYDVVLCVVCGMVLCVVWCGVWCGCNNKRCTVIDRKNSQIVKDELKVEVEVEVEEPEGGNRI